VLTLIKDERSLGGGAVDSERAIHIHIFTHTHNIHLYIYNQGLHGGDDAEGDGGDDALELAHLAEEAEEAEGAYHLYLSLSLSDT
jgi:hypothetical protein